MKKFLLDYISALLNDECNSLKICIRDLDQRSNSIDMYQENSLPPTTRNVERSLAHGTEQRNTLLTFFFHFLYRKKYIYSTLAVPTVPERIFSLFLAVLERDGVKNSLLSLAVPTVLLAPGITNL
jgi:hypothetical protein